MTEYWSPLPYLARLMRHKLSPLATTVLAALGVTVAERERRSDKGVAAAAGCSPRAENFRGSAIWVAELESWYPCEGSLGLTWNAIVCLDVTWLPSCCPDRKVRSWSPGGSRGGVMTNCPDRSAMA